MITEYLHYLQEENIIKTKILSFLNLLNREPKGVKFRKKDWSLNETSNLKKIRYLKLIDKFKIPKDEALIMGSSVLVLHGFLEKNNDLDLIVTRHTLNKMRESKNFVRDFKYNKVFYKTPSGSLEVAVNFQVLNEKINTLLNRSDEINDYRFMTLKDTYRMYRILNRPKDVEKLRKLKDHFKRKENTRRYQSHE